MGVAKLTDQNTVVPESKYARVERERRFLLKDLPEGLTRADTHLQITDNYITGTRLRLRKVRDPRTNKWTVKFTQKFAPNPEDLSRTIITNTYLNALEAETLSVFNTNEIRKNRYYFDFQGRRFSIDMFLGDLFGLVLAEVGFETDEDLDNFGKPPFALADVTNDPLFSGGRLCELTFPEVRQAILRARLLVTTNHMRSIFPLLLIALVITAGCRKTATPPVSTTAATPTPAEQQLTGGTTPPPQTKHFKGSIGSTLDLQMKLVRDGDQLTGSYFYQKVGTRITLRGTVDKDGNLTLDEFDPSGKQTGVFKGLWKAEPEDGLITLAGNWSKASSEKGDDKKTAFSVHEEPINFSGDVDVIAKSVKENNKKLKYEIDAQYPQLTGGNNPNFAKFNQAARAIVMKNVTGFKKEMAPAEGEDPPPEGSMGSDIGIGYTIALAQDDLISVQFNVGSYYQGAAHPNSSTETLNYDLKNGKALKLPDLFKPGSKYLQTIATYCVADLKKQSKDKNSGLLEGVFADGAAPKSENYEGGWTITKRGLGIYFDSYQVGPYAAGPQFVMVPYSAVKDLIKPDGPIAQFAQ